MRLQEDCELKPYNTFGVSARAEALLRIEKPEELREFIASPWRKKPVEILGEGSNFLFTRDVPGCLLKLEDRSLSVEEETEASVRLKVGAGFSWHALVLYCVERCYSGIENLALIPGTVGAAPVQNIGAYGVELNESVEEVEAFHLETGVFKSFSRQACRFAYRDSFFKTSEGLGWGDYFSPFTFKQSSSITFGLWRRATNLRSHGAYFADSCRCC